MTFGVWKQRYGQVFPMTGGRYGIPVTRPGADKLFGLVDFRVTGAENGLIVVTQTSREVTIAEHADGWDVLGDTELTVQYATAAAALEAVKAECSRLAAENGRDVVALEWKPVTMIGRKVASVLADKF